MATAKLNPTLSEAIGTMGKRKKRAYPLHRLDLTMQTYPHSAKLNKKPKPTKRRTEKQDKQRDLFKEADCIYYRLPPSLKQVIETWAMNTSKTNKEGLSAYNAFMQAMLNNYCPDLLQDYFCIDLSDPLLTEKDDMVEISTSIIFKQSIEEFEGWFERITRRT